MGTEPCSYPVLSLTERTAGMGQQAVKGRGTPQPWAPTSVTVSRGESISVSCNLLQFSRMSPHCCKQGWLFSERAARLPAARTRSGLCQWPWTVAVACTTCTGRTIDEGGRAKVCSTDLKHFILAFCFLFISSFSCGCLVSLYSAVMVLNADDNVAFMLGAVHSGCKYLTFWREKRVVV